MLYEKLVKLYTAPNSLHISRLAIEAVITINCRMASPGEKKHPKSYNIIGINN